MQSHGDGPPDDQGEDWLALQRRVARAYRSVADVHANATERTAGGTSGTSDFAPAIPPPPRLPVLGPPVPTGPSARFSNPPTGLSDAPVALETAAPRTLPAGPEEQSIGASWRLFAATLGFAVASGLALYGAHESSQAAQPATAALAGWGPKLAAISRVHLGLGESTRPDGAGASEPDQPIGSARIVLPVTVIAEPRQAAGSSQAALGALASASAAADEASAPASPRLPPAAPATVGGAAPTDGKAVGTGSPPAPAETVPGAWAGGVVGSAMPGSTSFEYHERAPAPRISTESQIPPTRLEPNGVLAHGRRRLR
jgi:hypothetical protein